MYNFVASDDYMNIRDNKPTKRKDGFFFPYSIRGFSVRSFGSAGLGLGKQIMAGVPGGANLPLS